MKNNVTYFMYGFTHAFNSSRNAYTFEKTWDITKRIQSERKERTYENKEKAKERIANLYS